MRHDGAAAQANLERISAIEAHLPGDFYRMHPYAQEWAWKRAAREAGVSPYPTAAG